MKRLDDNQIDRAALLNFEKTLGIMDPVVIMKQIHGGNVALVENLKTNRIPDTDGMVTDKRYIPLAVLTADCLPILLYNPQKQAIGVAHAGYKGLLNHIIENTVDVFVTAFQSDPQDIIVGIGPCIETMCYEVGSEVIEKFEKTFSEFTNMYTEKDKKTYLDLENIALQCLQKSGILKKHIEVMDICTKCDEHFYSYREGDGDRRFASIISLV